MFTKRKVVKKNVKKNLDDLINEEKKEKEKEKEKERERESEREREREREKRENKESQEEVKKNVNANEHLQPTRLSLEIGTEDKRNTEKEKQKLERNHKNSNQKHKKDKKKKSFKERKKEEETNKVNKATTSFLIYSDDEDGDDSDNFIAIKKKKRNQRFDNYLNKLVIKEMKKEERTVIKNNNLKDISEGEIRNFFNKKKNMYIIEKSDKENKHEKEEMPQSNAKYFDKYNNKYIDRNERNNENQSDDGEDDNASDIRKKKTMKLHNNNFYLNMKDEDDDLSKTHENIKETYDDFEKCENCEKYNYIQSEQNIERDIQKKTYFTQIRSVEKKVTQKEEPKQCYNMFVDENNDNNEETIMVNFVDEKEDNDEETKQLIEKIKIKKQILRKKKEMNKCFERCYGEDSYEITENKNNDKNMNLHRNKMYLSTFDFQNISVDDDFEIEDIYNYETLSELKEKLLIKKNKNQEVNVAFQDFHKKNWHENVLLSESEEENKYDETYTKDEFLEKEKIQNIVNKRIMAYIKKENDFYEANRDEQSEKTDEEHKSGKERFNNLDKDFCISKSQNNFNKGNALDETQEYEVGVENKSGERKKYNINRTKPKAKDKVSYIKADKNGLEAYNKTNEKLFEKIKKTYEDQMVCNLQLVKMKKYIYSLFNEYKNKQNKYNRNENTKSKNKEEYKKIIHLCKNKKNEIIICTLFIEFCTNIKNFILEKSGIIHSALQTLKEMEKAFYLIYQQLKLYLYKDFYEKYKFTFTSDYIFHKKYYRSKKENHKKQQLRELEKENILMKNESLDIFSDCSENIIEQLYDVKQFDNPSFLYLFDGFSSNYSSDSSNDTDERIHTTTLDLLKVKMENKKNWKEEKKKKQLRKQKYCQTLKMKQLKKKFGNEINNLCNDVKKYFLNFKNVIKHFYILKCFNLEIYRKWNCSNYFEDIFFFFVKWELLHWDPIFQFSIKKKQKEKNIIDYWKSVKDIKSFHYDQKNTEAAEMFDSYSSIEFSHRSCSEYSQWQNESDSERSDDDSFSLESSNDSSCISSEEELEDPTEKEEAEKGEISKDVEKNKKKKSNEKKGETKKGENNKKKDIKKKDGKSYEQSENTGKKLFPLFQNLTFRVTKYHLPKYFFHNPSIKSFEWYKFMENIMIIYDVDDEKIIFNQLYKKVMNARVYELIEIWNPFSLKQSTSMYVIIKEFVLYNNFDEIKEGDAVCDKNKKNKITKEINNKPEKERRMLIEKIKAKINECRSIILESCKHIDNLKKKSTFLMRCLKFFKSLKNVLYLLKDQELSEILKNIYYDFVLKNYVDSVKFHNFIFSAIIDILHCLNFHDKDFKKEIDK